LGGGSADGIPNSPNSYPSDPEDFYMPGGPYYNGEEASKSSEYPRKDSDDDSGNGRRRSKRSINLFPLGYFGSEDEEPEKPDEQDFSDGENEKSVSESLTKVDGTGEFELNKDLGLSDVEASNDIDQKNLTNIEDNPYEYLSKTEGIGGTGLPEDESLIPGTESFTDYDSPGVSGTNKDNSGATEKTTGEKAFGFIPKGDNDELDPDVNFGDDKFQQSNEDFAGGEEYENNTLDPLSDDLDDEPYGDDYSL
jgi:hypothetical protein